MAFEDDFYDKGFAMLEDGLRQHTPLPSSTSHLPSSSPWFISMLTDSMTSSPLHPAPLSSPLSLWFPKTYPSPLDSTDLEYTSESDNLDEMDWTSKPLDSDDMWWEPTLPFYLVYENCFHSGVNYLYWKHGLWQEEEE